MLLPSSQNRKIGQNQRQANSRTEQRVMAERKYSFGINFILAGKPDYFQRQICPSAFYIQIDGTKDKSQCRGWPCLEIRSYFCFAKHSCLFMHLPGALAWSVTKKENRSFLPLDPSLSFTRISLSGNPNKPVSHFGTSN